MLPAIAVLVKGPTVGRRNLLKKNFTKPSNVCARPDTIVPTAAKAVEIIPQMVLTRDWKTARIELRTAVMAPKIEEMKLPRESMREGMIAVGLFVRFLVWCLNCGQCQGGGGRLMD
jgi:hypothetical protein